MTEAVRLFVSEGINVEKLIISFTLLLKRNHIYRRIF